MTSPGTALFRADCNSAAVETGTVGAGQDELAADADAAANDTTVAAARMVAAAAVMARQGAFGYNMAFPHWGLAALWAAKAGPINAGVAGHAERGFPLLMGAICNVASPSAPVWANSPNSEKRHRCSISPLAIHSGGRRQGLRATVSGGFSRDRTPRHDERPDERRQGYGEYEAN